MYGHLLYDKVGTVEGEKVVVFLIKERGTSGSQMVKILLDSSSCKNKNQIDISLKYAKKIINSSQNSREEKLYNFGVEHDLLNKTQKAVTLKEIS